LKTAPSQVSRPISDRIDQRFKEIIVRVLKMFLRKISSLKISDVHVKSILIVRQHDQLGDMLCAIPMIRALKNRFPDARISLVTSPVNHEIMRNHPFLNEVIKYEKSPQKLWKFYKLLKSRSYDLALVPATVSLSVTSDVISYLSGAKIRIGAASLNGRKNPTSFCFSECVDLDWRNEPGRHQARRNLDLLKNLQIDTDDITSAIGLSKEEVEKAEIYISGIRKKQELIVGFHPGAGKVENRWPAHNFALLAEKISSECGAVILITVGPMDELPFREMSGNLNLPHEIIYKRPLREVAAIIDQLDIFITNDTGLMHIAGATRTRLLALFGPTEPMQWAPSGLKNRFIYAKDRKIGSISLESVYGTFALMREEIIRQKSIN